MRTVRGSLEAVALLAIGFGGLAYAMSQEYGRLMNQSFRPVTVGGAVLVAVMGLSLLHRPRRSAGPSAFLVFALFLAVLVIGKPLASGVTPALSSLGPRPSLLERAGYEDLEAKSLLGASPGEAADVAEGAYVVSGLVYRNAATDAQGEFVLVEPLMACCLADAIGFGVRVRTSPPLPDSKAWVYAFGNLERLSEPVVTPRFRMGAIMFTTVSRHYVLDAEEVVPHRALLEDVVAKIPADRCGRFREALETTGLAETLRGDGPYTVFVPLDLVFDQRPDAAKETLLGDFVVAGYHSKKDLFSLDALTTISGRKLPIETVNGRLLVNGARVLFGDQMARNGVLHIVHPGWIGR